MRGGSVDTVVGVVLVVYSVAPVPFNLVICGIFLFHRCSSILFFRLCLAH